MNAIERLRDLTDWVGTAEPERTERESALAAVDALYQAAAGFITAADNEMTGWREGEHDEWPEFVALAAAVRKVEGQA